MDENTESAPGSRDGFDWQDHLSVLVLVGITTVVYGLVSIDWAFAELPLPGCGLWIVVAAALNGLRRGRM